MAGFQPLSTILCILVNHSALQPTADMPSGACKFLQSKGKHWRNLNSETTNIIIKVCLCVCVVSVCLCGSNRGQVFSEWDRLVVGVAVPPTLSVGKTTREWVNTQKRIYILLCMMLCYTTEKSDTHKNNPP